MKKMLDPGGWGGARGFNQDLGGIGH